MKHFTAIIFFVEFPCLHFISANRTHFLVVLTRLIDKITDTLSVVLIVFALTEIVAGTVWFSILDLKLFNYSTK